MCREGGWPRQVVSTGENGGDAASVESSGSPPLGSPFLPTPPIPKMPQPLERAVVAQVSLASLGHRRTPFPISCSAGSFSLDSIKVISKQRNPTEGGKEGHESLSEIMCQSLYKT